jgi:parallel beta-helix repeat protein
MYQQYLTSLSSKSSSSSLSWQSYMSDIDDQQSEECCGYFAAAAIVEGQLQILYGSRIGNEGINLDELKNHNPDFPAPVSTMLSSIKISKISSEVGNYPNYAGVMWTVLTATNRSINLSLPLTGIDRIIEALQYGPITAEFKIYEDFPHYYWRHSDDAVYHWDGVSEYEEYNHAVAIVGYYEDVDEPENSYWLCKNSWGESWGDDGYFRMGFGECGIETINNMRVTVDNTCYAKICPNLQSFQDALNTPWVDDEELKLLSNTTISSNQSVTVPGGTIISIADDLAITVNGIIIADGTISSPIVFTSSDEWDGLKFINASSSSVLDYCEIENASNGLYLDNSNPTITNCYIHDNTYNGVQLVNTSNPVLKNNSIKDNGTYGVNCYNYSEPTFGSGQGYNVITGNNNGIISSYGSFVELGYYIGSGYIYAYNSIYDNTNDNAIAIYDGEIVGHGCWWGSSDPNVFTTKFETGIPGDASEGSLSYLYYLTSYPGGGSSLGKAGSGVGQEMVCNPEYVDENNPEELYNLALYYKAQNNTSGLIKTAKDIVERFPESKYAEKAICRIFHANEKEKLNGLKSYLMGQSKRKLNDNLQGTINNFLISKYIREKEYEKAEALCKKTIDEPLNNQNELYAYYNLISLNKNSMERTSEAKFHLSEMKNKYPNETMTLLACEIMGENVDWDNINPVLLKQSINTEKSESKATEFALHSAYPNPFNPSTNINFSLEKQSKVDIRIYNIQGKEVWNWGNNLEYGSGSHNITWNAIDDMGNQLSTGVYFIKLVAGNQIATQKVIFMK